MAVIDIVAMKAALAPGGRLFGLDIGSKTIGIAVSDSALKVASPLTVLPRVKFAADMAKLKGLIAERSVGGLVLGLPIGLDGREGPRSQSVRQFAANLLAVIDLPLAFWDERFSTLGAERPMKEAEMSHRRRGELIDKLAAAYILQGALDRIAASDPPA
ncbi:MAG TPA: Holliday junction resolvase RuvX [Dongiaceae bacterium]|jgi:putative Holliday junction resolvase